MYQGDPITHARKIVARARAERGLLTLQVRKCGYDGCSRSSGESFVVPPPFLFPLTLPLLCPRNPKP
eukprot:1077742-Rhodomonas_salina.1